MSAQPLGFGRRGCRVRRYAVEKVVYTYWQEILIPLPSANERLALRAINEANGRDPDSPFSLEDICKMSTSSMRTLTIDVYSDGTRRIRGAI
jgi:hypothetical protein